jgi:hypothetical protein
MPGFPWLRSPSAWCWRAEARGARRASLLNDFGAVSERADPTRADTALAFAHVAELSHQWTDALASRKARTAQSKLRAGGTPPMFTKILIANRGEIACRVIKTARGWASRRWRSIPTPTAMRCMSRWPTKPCISVQLAAAESYLQIEKIIAACKADRRRGRASRLRLPLRARGFRQGVEGERHRLHRPQPGRDRRDGRQDRVEEGGGQCRQGLDRSGLPRRDRGP